MIRARDRCSYDVEHKSQSKVAFLMLRHACVRRRRRRGEDARRMGGGDGESVIAGATPLRFAALGTGCLLATTRRTRGRRNFSSARDVVAGVRQVLGQA